jgi:hypothetical protein
MPNLKAQGVAYSDPIFEDVRVNGPIVASGSITGAGIVSTAASGAVASNATAGIYILSTAITNNVTATTAPSGSLGITSNATGLGKLFYSNGSVWLFAAIT